MEIFLAVIGFLIGLILIIKGGDFFVDAATYTARATHIPEFIIGATIVSVATTLPELLVSLIAASEGSANMAVGNAVGSVTANLGLILAISLLFAPGIIRRQDYLLKSVTLIAAVALLWGLSLSGQLPAGWSCLLFVLLALFVFDSIRGAKGEPSTEPAPVVNRKTILINVLKFVGGAAALAVGADLLVDNASVLASVMGVSEGIIGVTIVAIGTSLPELTTTVIALRKKQASLSVGNIIGANVLDTCLILPLCAVVQGGQLPVADVSRLLDMPVCLLLTLVALVPTLITKKFSRWQGAALAVLYMGYLVLLVINEASFGGVITQTLPFLSAFAS